jgi:WNK lysine deficient protein kinase
VGRCLAHVSKRPSAKELLLDPFLATEQLELSLPNKTLSTKQTSRNMTITGSLNEEDNTIFLKVRISDETGVQNSFPNATSSVVFQILET